MKNSQQRTHCSVCGKKRDEKFHHGKCNKCHAKKSRQTYLMNTTPEERREYMRVYQRYYRMNQSPLSKEIFNNKYAA